MSRQALPIPPDLVAKLLGNRVAVSPIVTVEPRRRKFHKPITLTVPVPKAVQKGMINQYGTDRPTLRLLYSLAGGWRCAATVAVSTLSGPLYLTSVVVRCVCCVVCFFAVVLYGVCVVLYDVRRCLSVTLVLADDDSCSGD